MGDQRMISKTLALLSTVFGLVGCASMAEKYQEPNSGPTASIRFVASSPLPGNVFLMAVVGDGECGSSGVGIQANTRNIGILHGLALAHDRKKLGMPLSEQIDEKDFTEIKIQAGKPFVFDTHLLSVGAGGFVAPGTYVPSMTGCNATVEFTPEEGKQYESLFTVDTSQKKCFVAVAELVRGVDTMYTRQPEKSAHSRSVQCKW